jgi:DNA-binding LacI/PurR family transcriptional regulator
MGPGEAASVKERVNWLVTRERRPDALVCMNDVTAISAMKASLEQGLRVPEDIGIIGFDDIEAAQFTHPGLTTLHQPMEQIIRESVQLLIARLAGTEKGPTKKRLYKPELIVRGST